MKSWWDYMETIYGSEFDKLFRIWVHKHKLDFTNDELIENFFTQKKEVIMQAVWADVEDALYARCEEILEDNEE
jgi:hypothetical protein